MEHRLQIKLQQNQIAPIQLASVVTWSAIVWKNFCDVWIETEWPDSIPGQSEGNVLTDLGPGQNLNQMDRQFLHPFKFYF